MLNVVFLVICDAPCYMLSPLLLVMFHVLSSSLLQIVSLTKQLYILIFKYSQQQVKGKFFTVLPYPEGVLGEWRYSSTHSLTSALDGGEWSASRPGRFTPRIGAPGTHWIRGWVGPRAVLDAVMKRKISSLPRESNPRTPIVQLVASHYTD
jgi:hypothetical protein